MIGAEQAFAVAMFLLFFLIVTVVGVLLRHAERRRAQLTAGRILTRQIIDGLIDRDIAASEYPRLDRLRRDLGVTTPGQHRQPPEPGRDMRTEGEFSPDFLVKRRERS